MKRTNLIGGGLMVGAGILLLLQNFGIFGQAEGLFWMVFFAVCGALLLGRFLTHRTQWWPLIPGFVFLSLAAVIGLNTGSPGPGAAWGGPVFLAGIGLGFWAVYAMHRRLWWPIIHGGALFTLATVAALDQVRPGQDHGSVFFLGIAVTFGLVYLLPTPGNRLRWALIPAGICGVMGLVILAASVAVLQYVWPAALICMGLYLVYRTLVARTTGAQPPKIPLQTTPKEVAYEDSTIPQPR